MFKLIAQDGTQYPITHPVTTIGREGCDILLLQDEVVSRQHAQLKWQGQSLVVADLGSTNGTFVNGVQVQSPRTLQPGDVIQVGDTTLTVRAEGKSPATRALSDLPPWQAPSASVTGVARQAAPAAVHQTPPAHVQPTKDKTLAYVLEILLLGLGWIYAGETSTGIVILVGWVVLGLMVGLPIDILTGGLGCLCTVPLAMLAYIFSITRLSKHMNARPDVFR